MNKALLILILVLGGTIWATAAHATTDADGVALCVGCTTPAQFSAAAKQAAGNQFNGDRTYLVVNPDTGMSRWVVVMNTTPGHDPLSTEPGKPITHAQKGVAIPMYSDPLADVFIAGDEQTPQFKQQFGGSSTIRWPVSTDEQSEINGVIEYNRDSYVILLPSDLFPSYSSTRSAELMGYINQVLVEKNSGWAEQSLSNSIRGFLVSKLQNHFGRKGKVCTIWVHGASACFAPNVDNPHADSQIGGSGKDGNKDPMPDLWTPSPVQRSGGGMGVYTGDPGQIGYNLAYTATWGSGLWVVCGKVGDTLIWCYLQEE